MSFSGTFPKNCTYASFNKEDHTYVVEIDHECSLDDFNIKDDVDLVKNVKDSLKRK